MKKFLIIMALILLPLNVYAQVPFELDGSGNIIRGGGTGSGTAWMPDTVYYDQFDLINAPGTDDTYTGLTFACTAGENLAQWDVIYSKNSSGSLRWYKYDANGTDKAIPARAMAVAAITSGNAGTCLRSGIVRNDGWAMTTNQDEGKIVYASATAGGITLTRPSAIGDVIQPIGRVLEENVIDFQPGEIDDYFLKSSITYYVCAKAAAGTCVYNGDAGTVATPSDANECTTKALPCATILGAKAKIANKILTDVVTIQLADAAGTGTDCYLPNGVIFDNLAFDSQGPYVFDVTLNSETDTYPNAYIYLVGNTTTPNSVPIVGATTCTGTTSSVLHAIYARNTNMRVRGHNFLYFKSAANVGENSRLYVETSNATSDNPTLSTDGILKCIDGTCFMGGPINITNYMTAYATHSRVVTKSPVGNLNLVFSKSAGSPFGFLMDEKAHLQYEGATTSFAGAGTYNAFAAWQGSTINWNGDIATSTTINGANITMLYSKQGGRIDEACGATDQTCVFTSMYRRARAENPGSVVSFYCGETNAYCSGTPNPGFTATDGGTIKVGTGTTILGNWSSTKFLALDPVTFANLLSLGNGTISFCSDCTIANPCAGSGNGAIAKRLNGVWVCN